jgi:RNase H-like domain found in reverse transcriptase
LTDALRGGLRLQAQLQWSAAMSAAFEAAKAAISAATQLAHPSPAADLALITDASGSHVGAVLQQSSSGQFWRPLGFFSQKLSPAESRYSAFDRELLAVYSRILHFRHLLEGRHFSVFFRPQAFSWRFKQGGGFEIRPTMATVRIHCRICVRGQVYRR